VFALIDPGKVRSPPIQSFNDGILSVYSVERDSGGVESLIVKYPLLRYSERTAGMSRFWKAKQFNVDITKVFRIARREDISGQDVVVLPDLRQYIIKQVQYPTDVTPPCCDLSLERVEHVYGFKPV